jgi:hypothetical protein
MKEALIAIVFIGLAVAGVRPWSDWRERRAEKDDGRPSIEAFSSSDPIAAEKPSADGASVQGHSSPEPKASDPSGGPAVDPAALDLKVLNGGAAKGSAAKAQSVLKAAGYARAQTGNASGDYAGTTVYYLDGYRDAAEKVGQALSSGYPAVRVKQAASNKSEEGGASVVVVLGK